MTHNIPPRQRPWPRRHAARCCATAAAAVAVVAAWADAAQAQEVKVSASARPATVAVGDVFAYTLEITTDGRTQVRLDQQPRFEGMASIGTSRGTQLRSDGSGTVMIQSLTYQVRAQGKSRTVTIPPVQVTAGTKTFTSNPVTVEVVPPGKVTKPTSKAGDDVAFVSLGLSEREPYVGEQVLVEYLLYMDQRRMGIFGAELRGLEDPPFDGVWIEDLSEHTVNRARGERVKGREYTVKTVKALAVFPLTAGPMELGAVRMEVDVSERRRMRRRRLRLETEPVTLKVKPLPKGAPEGFSENNVGQYTLQVTADKARAAVGEPVTVSIQVKGQGMVGRVELPELPKLDGFRRLDPVVRKDPRRIASGVYGSKTAEVVVIPEREGRLTIPAIELHTFHPEKGAYVTLTSSPLAVQVRGQAKVEERREALIERDTRDDEPEAVRVARQPLRPLRPMRDRAEARRPVTEASALVSPVFWLGLVGPPLGFAVWVGAGAARRRLSARAEAQAEANASGRALDALDDAERVARSEASRDAYGMIASALGRYLSEALDIPPGALSPTRVERALGERGVDDALITQVRTLRARCDDARFAPDASEPAEALVGEARALVKALARGLA